MTTKVKDVILPWDYFLGEEYRDNPHLDAFRRNEWPNILRELDQAYNYVVPEGLEPHWTRPFWAKLWQEQIVQTPQQVLDDHGNPRLRASGIPLRELRPVSHGWNPVEVPLGNSSQLAQMLKKGLRLRPPEDGVDAEITLRAASLVDGSAEPEPVEYKYFCNRHGQDLRAFTQWKNYIRHCRRYREEPEGELSPEARARMENNKYYCRRCDQGFQKRKSALRHIKTDLLKPGRPQHPTLIDMEEFRRHFPAAI